MTSALKILVSGDVNGKLKQFFSRIDAVNKKSGPFDMIFCVGEFFGDAAELRDYQNGTYQVPVLTYVLGPCSEPVEDLKISPEGCEICSNLIFLGKRGLLTGSSGLRVAYLSGIESKKDSLWNFSAKDLQSFQDQLEETGKFNGTDILLTSQWPRGVTKYAKSPDGLENSSFADSEAITQLALQIKPRYHFCALEGISYERLPYRNHQILHEKSRPVTRFISLAKFGNQQKAKWLYAFSISPLNSMDQSELNKQPPDVTECPYVVSAAAAADRDKPDYSTQFFYSLNEDGTEKVDRKRGRRDNNGQQKKQKSQPRPTGPCWFCLGSPEVEKHLVVSVGTNVYLTIAKGALVPDHILILPIGHYKSTIELTDEVLEEVEEYKTSLRKFYASVGKAPVFYERNFRSPHLQIQVVPIPLSKATVVKETFLNCADDKNIDLAQIPRNTEIKQAVQGNVPYFYTELPSKEKLFYQIRKGFPLQFGREVLASPGLLNLPGKEDWKACTLSKEDEIVTASKFREAFQTFDFTLL